MVTDVTAQERTHLGTQRSKYFPSFITPAEHTNEFTPGGKMKIKIVTYPSTKQHSFLLCTILGSMRITTFKSVN